MSEQPWPPPPDDPRWARLQAPFGADEIELLPKPLRKGQGQMGDCSECHGRHLLPAVHLHYVGHADVTRRLNEVDPTWTWEPMARTPEGAPLITNGGLWIWFTILGVTRPAYGDAGPNSPSPVKEMIGDAIRNGAMRAGVSLDLWSNSDRAQAVLARNGAEDDRPPGQAPPLPPAAAAVNTVDRLRDAETEARQASGDRERLRQVWHRYSDLLDHPTSTGKTLRAVITDLGVSVVTDADHADVGDDRDA